MKSFSSSGRRRRGDSRKIVVIKLRFVLACFLTLISVFSLSVVTILSRRHEQEEVEATTTNLSEDSWQDSFFFSRKSMSSSASSSLSSPRTATYHQDHKQGQQEKMTTTSEVAAINRLKTNIGSNRNDTTTTSSSSSSSSSFLPTIDIMSIGSLMRPLLQQAQRETFASHASIRHFFPITEHNDTSEPTCHIDLKLQNVRRVVNFCRRPNNNNNQNQHYHLEKMRQHYATMRWLSKKENPPGWLCAQKRPMDGFAQVMSFYQQHSLLPDYLIIMDDDTYMNMNRIVDLLPHSHAPNSPPQAIAGCRIRSRVYEHNMTIPFGGMGVILTRGTLEKFSTPIVCDTSNTTTGTITPNTDTSNLENLRQDDFVRLACWRLAQNGAGEAPLFRQGMSLFELMHAYTTAYPYLHVEHWKQGGGVAESKSSSSSPFTSTNGKEEGVGYCMHSDWMWGYFINVYPVSVHTSDEAYFQTVLEDRLQGYNGSTIYAGRKTKETNAQLKECRHKNAAGDDDESQSCPPESHICHRLSEQRMRQLYQQQQQQQQDLQQQ